MRKNNLEVSVIIPNYNGYDLLVKNLPHVLAAYRNKKNGIKEIILVDDASKDDSVSLVKKIFPQIKIIKHRVNRGFSASVNMGVRCAGAGLITLLNTDVYPERDFLIHALHHFRKENVFGVSFHEENFGWARGVFKDGFIVHEPGMGDKTTKETFWVNGGSGIFRRKYWMELGGMDEKLFSPFYWEDVDLSYRAAKRGWINLWEPKAHVVHEHESTIRKIAKNYRARIQQRNQLLFIWKNLTSQILFRKHVIGLFQRLSRHPGYILIVLAALPKLKIVVKERKKEMKEAKVADETIFAKFRYV